MLARAFYRVSPSASPITTNSARRFSRSAVIGKWEGRKAEENTVREKDKYNVQQDATRDGKEERSKDEGGQAATEKGGGYNEKAKKDHPEAPDPIIGMNDERGGKGH